ncbi:MAG TPA: MOSC domain-containing protein [Bryobacteraceae bacterium]|jgi:MOSC domain-containing protein YiiM
MITTLGLEGDGWAHPHIHGGPRQRVLIISAEMIDELAARGFPVFYGALGENLTVRGLTLESLRAGQTWRAGDAMIELTKVRKPCATLDVYRHPDGRPIQAELYDDRVQAGDFTSPLWARSGFYALVHRQGLVTPGAPFELMSDLA